MPCERKHIEAIRDILDCSAWAPDVEALRAAISAALAACDEHDAEFQKAKEALARWDDGCRAEYPEGSNMDIVRDYFNRVEDARTGEDKEAGE